jgi:hypothetical protein
MLQAGRHDDHDFAPAGSYRWSSSYDSSSTVLALDSGKNALARTFH